MVRKVQKGDRRAARVRRIAKGGSESRRNLEGALYDLWMDSEERPVRRKETREVRALVSRHLGEIRLRAFDLAQKAIDAGLKADDLEGMVIPATEKLGIMYKQLKVAMLGEKP